MSGEMNAPAESHGFSLELDDGEEVLVDVGQEADIAPVVCTGDKVYYGQNEIVDVFDCETEDHLVPSGWHDEWIRPLQAGEGKE